MSTHTFQRANPPALVITLALEQPITVNLVAASEGQQQRILDWLNARREFQELVDLALDLARKQRAA